MLWNRLGMVVSSLCVVHCAAMPFVLAWLPTLGSSLPGDVHLHRWLAGASVLLCGASFLPAFRQHRRRHVVGLACFGLICLLSAAISQEDDCCRDCCREIQTVSRAEPDWWTTLRQGLTPFGGVCLTVAHLLNRCRKPCCDRECSVNQITPLNKEPS